MMKPLLAALAFAGVLGLLSWQGGGEGVDMVTVGSIPASAPASANPIFELSHGGEKCLLHRAGVSKQAGELVDYGCAALLPAFEEGLYWSETGEGTIAFVTKGGRTVAEFSAADGAGYESFSPREPILQLIEKH